MYGSEVAAPDPDKVFVVPKFVKVCPPSVETWKLTFPVGVPYDPETITEAVTVPKATGLVGVSVGVLRVGRVFTVKDAELLLTLL